MNGPRLAGVLVTAVMLGGLTYIAWISRKAHHAFASDKRETPAHVDRVERAIQDAEADMAGQGR